MWYLDLGCGPLGPGFLRSNRNPFLDILRIVRTNLRADAVLERSNDLTSRSVVLRVGAEHDRHIQWQAHRITLNLHIALLHDVEKRNLNLACKIGEFVDREDATVSAWQQAIVHGQFRPKILVAARGLNRIDITYKIGHRNIRRSKLFDKAVIRRKPGDRRVVSHLRNQVTRKL